MLTEKQKKFIIFKQAVCRALKKLTKDTAYTTVVGSYEISPSILTPIFKGIKDPQLSTIFRVSQAYQLDPRDFVGMVIDELPQGFVFSEE